MSRYNTLDTEGLLTYLCRHTVVDPNVQWEKVNTWNMFSKKRGRTLYRAHLRPVKPQSAAFEIVTSQDLGSLTVETYAVRDPIMVDSPENSHHYEVLTLNMNPVIFNLMTNSEVPLPKFRTKIIVEMPKRHEDTNIRRVDTIKNTPGTAQIDQSSLQSLLPTSRYVKPEYKPYIQSN